jgi:VanZ family protein
LLIAAVGYLALTPQPPPSIDLGWDKLNHLSAFAAMAFAGCFSFPGSARQRVAMLFGLLAYGGLIEILQLYIPGRSGEWADLFADSLGISVGTTVAAVTAVIIGRLAARQTCRGAPAGQPLPQPDGGVR